MLAKINLTLCILFFLNLQLVKSQIYFEKESKAERFIQSMNQTDLKIGSENHAEIEFIQSPKVKTDLDLSEQTKTNQTEYQKLAMTNLFDTDKEEDISVELWMLNPCDWLCKE